MPNGNGKTTPRYAFYDKTKETQNGWVWYHRELALDDINKCFRDVLQSKMGNEILNKKGFVTYNKWRVCYSYCPADKDDKGRDHWVLLTAWLSIECPINEVWEVFDNEIFQHVAKGNYALPQPQLSPFDYKVELVKLTYEGGKLEKIPLNNGRRYAEEIEKRGAVNIVFYCENPDGTATIETKKKT